MNQRDNRVEPAFPGDRPSIEIQPTTDRLTVDAVDCRELRWWFVVPQIGAYARWAVYEAPMWKLTSTVSVQGTRQARIHDISGVELVVKETSASGEVSTWAMYGRLNVDTAQWIATVRVNDGIWVLSTFLDEGFEQDWGTVERVLRAERLTMHDIGDGVERLDLADRTAIHCRTIGIGWFRVNVGGCAYDCPRVLDLCPEDGEAGTLIDAYIGQDGRTRLCRRFNGRLWRQNVEGAAFVPWDERFPFSLRIVLNGQTYVHWYDDIPDWTLGTELNDSHSLL